MDKSLDEIITQKRINVRRRYNVGGRRRSNPIGSTTRFKSSFPRRPIRSNGLFTTRDNINGQWKHDLYKESGNNIAKLIIDNLDFGVSDSDLQGLFSEFGQILSSKVFYDRSGRSLGKGNVIFDRRRDAISAVKQYNGVPLDGKPMKLSVEDKSDRSDPPRRFNGSNNSRPNSFRSNNYGGGRSNFNRRSNGNSKHNLTAEELDKQMDEYNKMTDD
ncbi:Aly/REF export factor [Intoshia linei]|uniref:Aly/REF export factor n=1 Tax=Intoshia linei TaxID=1819745 RepID=A0A177AYV6_9BILA|nr:Aly/REF export factor [Intoshia linei]